MSCQTSYPEVYQSYAMRNALRKEPVLPEAPKEPVKPTIAPGPDGSDNGFGGIAVFAVILAVVVIGCMSSGTLDVSVSMIIGVVLLALFSIIIASAANQSKQEKTKEHNQSKATYNTRLAQYERDYSYYQKELEEYNAKVENMKSAAYLLNFRKTTVRDMLNNREKPTYSVEDNVDSDYVIKKGVSEQYFYEEIKKGIKGNFELLFDAVVPVGETYYYPDILFVGYGLVIDIEIDEPYAGNDGTPIHYIKTERYSADSIDYKRNDYLSDKGFEIIRFAEEQVFLNTQKCISYIVNFIKNILAGNAELPNADDFAVNKWTYEDSAKLAYQRFRNTYVPQSLQPMINNETHHSYEDFDRNIGGGIRVDIAEEFGW